MKQLDDVTVADRSRRTADHQLLSDTRTDESERDQTSQHAPGYTGHLPAGIFDDPPIVDVFEGVTSYLLLIRAAPPIFIPEHAHRKQAGVLVWGHYISTLS